MPRSREDSKVFQKGANTGIGQHFFMQPGRPGGQTNNREAKKDEAGHERYSQPNKSKDYADATNNDEQKSCERRH
jgi:hypothetical protein